MCCRISVLSFLTNPFFFSFSPTMLPLSLFAVMLADWVNLTVYHTNQVNTQLRTLNSVRDDNNINTTRRPHGVRGVRGVHGVRGGVVPAVVTSFLYCRTAPSLLILILVVSSHPVSLMARRRTTLQGIFQT